MSNHIQLSEPSKPQRRRAPQTKPDALNIKLPREFVALCAAQDVPVTPAELVRYFIADLCGIPAWSTGSRYASLGPAAQEAARAYHQVACQARRDKVARHGDSDADSEQREG